MSQRSRWPAYRATPTTSMPAAIAHATATRLSSSSGPGSAREARPATAARANGSIAGRRRVGASRPRIER